MKTSQHLPLQDIAKLLDRASRYATAVNQISQNHTFTEADAYEIQRLSIEERIARGEKLIGLKLGFTSYAKMEQMGVHDMIWGRLTDTMLSENNSDIDLNKFIHPRAEPEICFRISKDIDREITLEEAPNFIDAVAPAIEIIDSRYQNFKFSLEDVIADNCSSAGLIIGDWLPVETNLSNLKMTLSVDDKIIETGNSDDILGNPWLSVVNAARLGVKYHEPLKKGMYLMAGAATSAVFIEHANKFKAEVEGMGEVAFEAV